MPLDPLCPPSAPFFGFMGAAAALIFASASRRLPAPRARRAQPVGRLHFSPARARPGPLLSGADLGAAYGTAKSGVGISSMGVLKPDLVMKSIIPVIMAGVLGIYGLIIAVIIGNGGASPARRPLARPACARTAACPPARCGRGLCPRSADSQPALAGRRAARAVLRSRFPGARTLTAPRPARAARRAVTPSEGGVPKYSLFQGFAHLSGGLACGLSGLAAGIAIGIVGDAGVRASAHQPKLYVGMVLILIFAEALGLYGLIVGLILTSKPGSCSQ